MSKTAREKRDLRKLREALAKGPILTRITCACGNAIVFEVKALGDATRIAELPPGCTCDPRAPRDERCDADDLNHSAPIMRCNGAVARWQRGEPA
jgi:hypothetical protein